MKKNNNKKSNKLHVVFLLDKSGSMHNAVSDTIGGYNSYIENNKTKDALVTTVLFDSNIKKLYCKKPIKEVNKLTEKDYRVGGCTSLYDAIGQTIIDIDKENNNEKVLFIITTDGYENSSRKFDKKRVSSLIKDHETWEFIYLGANIDSYAEASSIGIKSNNTANYSKTKAGINRMFKSVDYLSCCIMQDKVIDDKWKKNLQ